MQLNSNSREGIENHEFLTSNHMVIALKQDALHFPSLYSEQVSVYKKVAWVGTSEMTLKLSPHWNILGNKSSKYHM